MMIMVNYKRKEKKRQKEGRKKVKNKK